MDIDISKRIIVYHEKHARGPLDVELSTYCNFSIIKFDMTNAYPLVGETLSKDDPRHGMTFQVHKIESYPPIKYWIFERSFAGKTQAELFIGINADVFLQFDWYEVSLVIRRELIKDFDPFGELMLFSNIETLSSKDIRKKLLHIVKYNPDVYYEFFENYSLNSKWKIDNLKSILDDSPDHTKHYCAFIAGCAFYVEGDIETALHCLNGLSDESIDILRARIVREALGKEFAGMERENVVETILYLIEQAKSRG